jgi:hypothetical protein
MALFGRKKHVAAGELAEGLAKVALEAAGQVASDLGKYEVPAPSAATCFLPELWVYCLFPLDLLAAELQPREGAAQVRFLAKQELLILSGLNSAGDEQAQVERGMAWDELVDTRFQEYRQELFANSVSAEFMRLLNEAYARRMSSAPMNRVPFSQAGLTALAAAGYKRVSGYTDLDVRAVALLAIRFMTLWSNLAPTIKTYWVIAAE